MKTRILFLITAILLSIGGVSAQVSIGLHGGHGKAWQDYGDDFTPPNGPLKINAFQFNASVYFPVSSTFSVGLEPGYSRRGAACEPGFFADNPFVVAEDATFYANYIQLPLMLRMQRPIWKQLQIQAEIGAGPSYMTKAYRDILFFSGEVERRDVNFDADDDVNRWDVGGFAGLGLSYPVGPGNIQLEGNYYYGLMDSSNVLTSKNRTLRFGLGYVLNL